MSKKQKETPDLPPPRVPQGQGTLYGLAILCSWLIPGSGHWLLGYRVRAVVFGAALLGLFWTGQHLADYRAVKRPVNKIFYWAQIGNGLSTLLSNRIWGQIKPPTVEGVDDTLSAHHNTGLLFTSVSGLLNMLAILHIADPRTWSGRALESRAEAGSPASAAGGST